MLSLNILLKGCDKIMSALKDITNQRFGNWLVIERAENAKNGNAQWLCECQCENKTRQIVVGSNLRNGHSTQCKLCKNKANGEKTRKDLTNKKFGKLIAIEYTGKSTPQGNAIWKCKCDCGRFTEVASNNLGKTISCGMCGPHSRGELKIEEILNKNNISFKTQFSSPDLVSDDTNKRLYFDFYVDNKYIIEFDGEQHYNYNGRGWNTQEHFINLQKRDKKKNQWCKDNNIPLIRISYTKLDTLELKDLQLETSKYIIT